MDDKLLGNFITNLLARDVIDCCKRHMKYGVTRLPIHNIINEILLRQFQFFVASKVVHWTDENWLPPTTFVRIFAATMNLSL